MSRNSIVDIATRYMLDGPEFEPHRVKEVLSSPHLPRLAPRPTQTHVKWAPRLFPRVKRLGRGVDQPISSSAEVKTEWSYTSSPPLVPPMACCGTTLPKFKSI